MLAAGLVDLLSAGLLPGGNDTDFVSNISPDSRNFYFFARSKRAFFIQCV